MPYPYYQGKTLDDVMHFVIKDILSKGAHIVATKGSNRELTGVLLEIRNPRARLSRTETRGKPYSCLGELCWYLARSDDLDFITYYIPHYKDYVEGDKIFGGYGPRLFSWRGINQLANVKQILSKKSSTRRAVVQLFEAEDINITRHDVPCTCVLQFMIRENKLYMISYMRSNDVYLGLPHDIFSFTMFQEILAMELDVEIGNYKHAVGSLHLYDKDEKSAEQFLSEGFQSTKTPMPAMPKGNPWPSIKKLLHAERAIRTSEKFDENILENLDPYWVDLIRLLQVHRCKINKDSKGIIAQRERITAGVYYPFIDKFLPSKS